jgi:serine/threonine protein kinase
MYCAPEVANEELRGFPSDIFSLGCVFLEMLTTLMTNSNGISLGEFHRFRESNGRHAYHLNLSKVLNWILRLAKAIHEGLQQHALPGVSHDSDADNEDLLATDLSMVECCFAMLQPLPSARITIGLLCSFINVVSQRPPNLFRKGSASVSVMPRNLSLAAEGEIRFRYIGDCCSSPLSRTNPSFSLQLTNGFSSPITSQQQRDDWQEVTAICGYDIEHLWDDFVFLQVSGREKLRYHILHALVTHKNRLRDCIFFLPVEEQKRIWEQGLAFHLDSMNNTRIRKFMEFKEIIWQLQHVEPPLRPIDQVSLGENLTLDSVKRLIDTLLNPSQREVPRKTFH